MKLSIVAKRDPNFSVLEACLEFGGVGRPANFGRFNGTREVPRLRLTGSSHV